MHIALAGLYASVLGPVCRHAVYAVHTIGNDVLSYGLSTDCGEGDQQKAGKGRCYTKSTPLCHAESCPVCCSWGQQLDLSLPIAPSARACCAGLCSALLHQREVTAAPVRLRRRFCPHYSRPHAGMGRLALPSPCACPWFARKQSSPQSASAVNPLRP